MPYAPLVIAALGIGVATACFLYLQVAKASSPKQVIVGSVAGTIVGVLALSFALVY